MAPRRLGGAQLGRRVRLAVGLPLSLVLAPLRPEPPCGRPARSRRASVTGLTVDVSSLGSWSRASSTSPATASTSRSPGLGHGRLQVGDATYKPPLPARGRDRRRTPGADRGLPVEDSAPDSRVARRSALGCQLSLLTLGAVDSSQTAYPSAGPPALSRGRCQRQLAPRPGRPVRLALGAQLQRPSPRVRLGLALCPQLGRHLAGAVAATRSYAATEPPARPGAWPQLVGPGSPGTDASGMPAASTGCPWGPAPCMAGVGDPGRLAVHRRLADAGQPIRLEARRAPAGKAPRVSRTQGSARSAWASASSRPRASSASPSPRPSWRASGPMISGTRVAHVKGPRRSRVGFEASTRLPDRSAAEGCLRLRRQGDGLAHAIPGRLQPAMHHGRHRTRAGKSRAVASSTTAPSSAPARTAPKTRRWNTGR